MCISGFYSLIFFSPWGYKASPDIIRHEASQKSQYLLNSSRRNSSVLKYRRLATVRLSVHLLVGGAPYEEWAIRNAQKPLELTLSLKGSC